jgi:hypothetical protein
MIKDEIEFPKRRGLWKLELQNIGQSHRVIKQRYALAISKEGNSLEILTPLSSNFPHFRFI